MSRNAPVHSDKGAAAGIYASPALPVYTAAKRGVVGLMRALAPTLAKENIRVNCTLPGVVQTNLCDEEAWKSFPSGQFTTTANIVAAVKRIIEGKSLTGKAVEISKDKTYYRDQYDFCDDAQAKTMGAADITEF